MYDILILGGGASGVFAALELAKKIDSGRIAILEGGDRILRKLSLTGNGQGNLSNENLTEKMYLGKGYFVERVLKEFTLSDTLSAFGELGIKTIAFENGRIYPESLQASSVSDLLRLKLENRGIKVFLPENILSLKKYGSVFEIMTTAGTHRAKSVIYALGGGAAPKLNTKSSNFDMLSPLGHTVTPLYPALVQLKIKGDGSKMLKGIKADVLLSILSNGSVKCSTRDELHFADGAISGPATFFLSPYAGELLRDHISCDAKVDFFPDISNGELLELLFDRAEKMGDYPSQFLFSTLLHNQIGRFILKTSSIAPETYISDLSDDDFIKLSMRAKNTVFQITDTFGFNFAQSTIGGVSLDEINPSTLESRLIKGLYFIGESLDVCGLCGGYNLQWAWSTAGMLAKNFNA